MKIQGEKMRISYTSILICFLLAIVNCDLPQKDSSKTWLLNYNQPAQYWTEALPVGNGSMGAMVYGKVEEEQIQFNHDEIWSGQPIDYQHPDAAKALPEIRRLLFEGKQKEAHKFAGERFMSQPLRQCAYQPFGNLILNFENHENFQNYQRELNLNSATSSVNYSVDDVSYTREIFASYPDQVIVVKLTANKPGKLSLTVTLISPHKEAEQVKIAEDVLGLQGRVTQKGANDIESKIRFEAQLRVKTKNGNTIVSKNGVSINNADEVTFFLTGASSYINYLDISGNPSEICNNTLNKIDGISYDKLKKRHLDNYKNLFNRVDIDLGKSEPTEKETDKRVKDFNSTNDPDLVALLFQYGRYLLISSSRPGSQPANLQGVWNDRLKPPWESKYTVNINTEMNYWPAELTNLSECHEPLFDVIKDCAQTGAKTAKTFYNSNGWVLHHNTDIWRGTAPINASNHGIWVTGGAWLCQHLWQRYEFTQDEDFLKNRAYPIINQATQFFADYLVEDPRNNKKWLISGPSNSPENGGLVMGPTMDHQIIRNLFSNCIQSTEILNVDSEFRSKLQELKARIAPNQIGQHGQLQEWLEDKDDPNNKHRHVSHLWGLHPGNEITKEKTPELFKAAQTSLEFRGDQGTGWSMGWKVNFWARLQDGDHALKILGNLLRLIESSDTEYRGGGIYPNLFDAHPPFQIDGNFGVTAGIAEMLLQSHETNENGDYILHLLPALPISWQNGHIKGLCARGGFDVDVYWKDGKLAKAEILSKAGKSCLVKYENQTIDLKTNEGKTFKINSEFRLL